MGHNMRVDQPPPPYNPDTAIQVKAFTPTSTLHDDGVAVGYPHASPRLHGTVKTLEEIAQHFDIEEEIAEDLRCCRCKITVIADDSGSMKSSSYVEGMPHITTRWQELQHTLARLLDMLLFLDPDGGFELYFLNSTQPGGKAGEPIWISSSAELQACWGWARPAGRTPLIKLVEKAAEARCSGERIMMVMTDGSPTDGSFNDLKKTCERKPAGVYMNFLMCTDDDDIVERYESSIDAVPYVDVHDDYMSERKQVAQCGGRMNYNYYLAKCVLGAKLAKYDNMDDGFHGKHGLNPSCACSIM